MTWGEYLRYASNRRSRGLPVEPYVSKKKKTFVEHIQEMRERQIHGLQVGDTEKPKFDEDEAFKWLQQEARTVGFVARKSRAGKYSLLNADTIVAADLDLQELAKAMAKARIIGAGGEDVRLPITDRRRSPR